MDTFFVNANISRILSAAVLLLLVFLSGLWLRHSGKPFPMAVFTIHKLVALGSLILVVTMAAQVHKTAPLQTVQIIAIAITAIFFAALIITGGMISLDKTLPVIILRIHQLVPYLTVISVGVTFYLLLFRDNPLTLSAF